MIWLHPQYSMAQLHPQQSMAIFLWPSCFHRSFGVICLSLFHAIVLSYLLFPSLQCVCKVFSVFLLPGKLYHKVGRWDVAVSNGDEKVAEKGVAINPLCHPCDNKS